MNFGFYAVHARATTAFVLSMLATCLTAGAGVPGKVVKPPRGAPPPETRTLNMPEAYRARAAAAGKRAVSSPQWSVIREPENQTPIFVQFNRPEGAAAKPAPGVVPRLQILQFISENATLFRLRDPASELIHGATTRDKTGREHVQFEQRFRGVPVWGASIIGHWSGEQGLYAINGRYQPSPDHVTRVEPTITPEAAIDRALVDLTLQRTIKTFSPKVQELLDYRGPEAELYLWNARQEEPLRLTWFVEVRPNLYERWRYFVDAHTGEILERYQASPSDGPAVGSGVDLHGNTVDLHTYEIEGLFRLIDVTREGFDPETGGGLLITLDAQFTDGDNVETVTSPDNVFTDPVAVSAHANIGKVYEYFLEKHGRKGIGGYGADMISLVHVTNKDGESMDNAFWNGIFVAYGDGGDVFSPLAGALDVAAHEMTHGIIEHTVGLEYRFQSGALNESFADIFGAMVDDEDWQVGEDIVNKAYYPSGAMRDLRDPHNGDVPRGNGWQPAHMDEYVELPGDKDKRLRRRPRQQRHTQPSGLPGGRSHWPGKDGADLLSHPRSLLPAAAQPVHRLPPCS